MDHEVKIYSTPTCPYCRMVKQFLQEHNISYIDLNVADDKAAAQEMIRKSGQMGVPVIDIDGQIIVGFDRVKVARILNLK